METLLSFDIRSISGRNSMKKFFVLLLGLMQYFKRCISSSEYMSVYCNDCTWLLIDFNCCKRHRLQLQNGPNIKIWFIYKLSNGLMTNPCFYELSANPINPIPYELNVVLPIKGFLTINLSWKYQGLNSDYQRWKISFGLFLLKLIPPVVTFCQAIASSLHYVIEITGSIHFQSWTNISSQKGVPAKVGKTQTDFRKEKLCANEHNVIVLIPLSGLWSTVTNNSATRSSVQRLVS